MTREPRFVTFRRIPAKRVLLAGALGFTLPYSAVVRASDPLPKMVEFNRDIRPILSDACFKCHGPDAGQRKARLRLDTETGAFAPRDVTTIIPGQPDQSELIYRITAKDPDEHMPPPEAARQLSANEIALLRRWIEQGAKWENHWAFIPPKRQAVPMV